MDNIEETTIVYLNPRQAKQFIMMQFLESVGAFDVKLGRVIIDFNAIGEIGNVSITYNYKNNAGEKLSTA